MTTIPEPLEQAKKLVAPRFSKAQFRVFVFGPGMKPDDQIPPPTVAFTDPNGLIEFARYLRFKTSEALTQKGYKVDLGETQSIIDFWNNIRGSTDPANMELSHADRICGAVIIYPASVGSFCELGLFASREDIAKKTLAIVHSGYSAQQSFFRLGLLEILNQEYGRHCFNNYENPDECVNSAVNFVTSKYSKLLRDYDLVDRGVLKKTELGRTTLGGSL